MEPSPLPPSRTTSAPSPALSSRHPPDSPFCHILAEVAFDNLVHAAREELYQEEEVPLHAHIEEFEPELQYPDPFDISPEASLRHQVSDPNDDIPEQELLPPVVIAPVATVPSPAPPSCSISPVFIKQETPEPPTLVFSPTVGVPAPPPGHQTYPICLFDLPTCTYQEHRHPHQYTLLYQGEDSIWYPQEEFLSQDFVSNIPTVESLDFTHPHFVTRFRGPIPHLAYLQCRTGVLSQVALCAKVSLHPHSLHFPLGYLEVSFKEALVLLFAQLRPKWRQHFEGSYLPFLTFDFLDGRRATVSGKMHFTENGLFVIDRIVRTEDSLCTNPHLFAFVPTPRTPANPLSLVGYADETVALVHTE